MKIKDMRNKTPQELDALLLELLKEQFKLRMQKATSQLNQTHLLGKIRRDIARVRTLLTEATLGK